MQTLEVRVAENKSRLVKQVLKEQGVSVTTKKNTPLPNAETIAAMDGLKAGKGVVFKNVHDLFTTV